MKRLLTLVIAILAIQAVNAQELRFDKDGKFKIAQFTDIHLTPGNADSEARIPQMIKTVVNAENPDLLVFTGDIVTAKPAMNGWQTIAKMCAEIGIPYAVTLGKTHLSLRPVLFTGDKNLHVVISLGPLCERYRNSENGRDYCYCLLLDPGAGYCRSSIYLCL